MDIGVETGSAGVTCVSRGCHLSRHTTTHDRTRRYTNVTVTAGCSVGRGGSWGRGDGGWVMYGVLGGYIHTHPSLHTCKYMYIGRGFYRLI